jgi:hypothetical protein
MSGMRSEIDFSDCSGVIFTPHFSISPEAIFEEGYKGYVQVINE